MFSSTDIHPPQVNTKLPVSSLHHFSFVIFFCCQITTEFPGEFRPHWHNVRNLKLEAHNALQSEENERHAVLLSVGLYRTSCCLMNTFKLKKLNCFHFLNISLCFLMLQCQLVPLLWDFWMPAINFKHLNFSCLSVTCLLFTEQTGWCILSRLLCRRKKKKKACALQWAGESAVCACNGEVSASYKKCRRVVITLRLSPQARQLHELSTVI